MYSNFLLTNKFVNKNSMIFVTYESIQIANYNGHHEQAL